MNIPPKALLCIVLASAIVGGFLERSVAKKSLTKTDIKETEQVQDNVVTTIKEHKNIDGSLDSTTTIVDKTKVIEDRQEHSVATIISPTPLWLISAAFSAREAGLGRIQPWYGLEVQRRILGPIYIGAMVDTDQHIAGLVGMQF